LGNKRAQIGDLFPRIEKIKNVKKRPLNVSKLKEDYQKIKGVKNG